MRVAAALGTFALALIAAVLVISVLSPESSRSTFAPLAKHVETTELPALCWAPDIDASIKKIAHIEDWDMAAVDVSDLKNAVLMKYSPNTLKITLISLGVMIAKMAISQIPFVGGVISGIVGLFATRLTHRITEADMAKFRIKKWTTVVPLIKQMAEDISKKDIWRMASNTMHNQLQTFVCDFQLDVIQDQSNSNETKRALILSLLGSTIDQARTNFANSEWQSMYYPPVSVLLIPRAVTLNIAALVQYTLLGGDASNHMKNAMSNWQSSINSYSSFYAADRKKWWAPQPCHVKWQLFSSDDDGFSFGSGGTGATKVAVYTGSCQCGDKTETVRCVKQLEPEGETCALGDKSSGCENILSKQWTIDTLRGWWRRSHISSTSDRRLLGGGDTEGELEGIERSACIDRQWEAKQHLCTNGLEEEMAELKGLVTGPFLSWLKKLKNSPSFHLDM